MAQWETKTKKIIEKNNFKKKQREFNEQHNTFLDMRRKKLSNLLQNEEFQYRNEIINNQESPQQVRAKMEEKLNALKREKEAVREAEVKKLLEKKFFDSADQLRKNESEAFAYSCYLEQENQMLDKLKQAEKEKQEEMVYVKLNEFDNMKKLEREKQDAEIKKQKVKQTYDYLQWQKQEQEAAVKRANELNELEKARLREQWKRDEQNEEENRLKQIEINKAVNRDIKLFNEQEEIERKRKSDFEKKKDKELVDSIVAKEKALDDIDKAEKEKKIKEFHQNKKYLEYVMNQKKEAEAWMDKIAQDEADRDYQKKQALWMAEEAKRIALLKQVYKEREKSVLYKKGVQEEEKRQIARERVALDEEIRNYNQKIAQIKREDALRRKGHQNELLYQISEKENMKRRELQDKLYEERAAQLWEMEYQKKINEQREIHLKRLQEIRDRNKY